MSIIPKIIPSAVVIGYWGVVAAYADNEGDTKPASSTLAYPLHHLGTIMSRIACSKETRKPACLDILMSEEELNTNPTVLKTTVHLAKFTALMPVVITGGILYATSKCIDKCVGVFSSTFLPDSMKEDLNATMKDKQETLKKMEMKDKEIISKVETLKKAALQDEEFIVKAQESADQQKPVIEKLKEEANGRTDEGPLLEQCEAFILDFIARLEQLPCHEKRVELMKKLMDECKTQEGINKELEERLKALPMAYAEEARMIEELTCQIEQYSLKGKKDDNASK